MIPRRPTNTVPEILDAVHALFTPCPGAPTREPDAEFVGPDGARYARWGRTLQIGDRCYHTDGPVMARWLYGRLTLAVMA
jgi:hypothetical protein